MLFKIYNTADTDSIKTKLVINLINLEIIKNFRVEKKYKKKGIVFLFLGFLIFDFSFLVLICLFYYIIIKLYTCVTLFLIINK